MRRVPQLAPDAHVAVPRCERRAPGEVHARDDPKVGGGAALGVGHDSEHCRGKELG